MPMHRETKQYLSDRLMPLLYWGPPPEVPTLTMEAYQKWYEMFLIHPDGSVSKVEFDQLYEVCGYMTPHIDHVPNPQVVVTLCNKRDWIMHALAHEVMVGRWNQEIKE